MSTIDSVLRMLRSNEGSTAYMDCEERSTLNSLNTLLILTNHKVIKLHIEGVTKESMHNLSHQRISEENNNKNFGCAFPDFSFHLTLTNSLCIYACRGTYKIKPMWFFKDAILSETMNDWAFLKHDIMTVIEVIFEWYFSTVFLMNSSFIAFTSHIVDTPSLRNYGTHCFNEIYQQFIRCNEPSSFANVSCYPVIQLR